jgi:acyl-CoA oxidase
LEEFKNLDTLLSIFAHRSSSQVFQTGKSFSTNFSKLNEEENWNYHLSDFMKLTHSHCVYLVFKSFVEFLRKIKDHSIYQVLLPLCCLFAFENILEKSGEFLISGILDVFQIGLLSDGIKQLLKEIRPNVVPLVDSFDFSDYYLNSAIGSYDGNYPLRLFESAKKDPLNQQDVSEAYTKYFSQFMKGNSKL